MPGTPLLLLVSSQGSFPLFLESFFPFGDNLQKSCTLGWGDEMVQWVKYVVQESPPGQLKAFHLQRGWACLQQSWNY